VKADQEAKEADMVINLGQQLSIPLILLGVGLIIYSIVKKDKIPHYIEQK
jgi:prolipoprotein diacylglyceryltransferase